MLTSNVGRSTDKVHPPVVEIFSLWKVILGRVRKPGSCPPACSFSNHASRGVLPFPLLLHAIG